MKIPDSHPRQENPTDSAAVRSGLSKAQREVDGSVFTTVSSSDPAVIAEPEADHNHGAGEAIIDRSPADEPSAPVAELSANSESRNLQPPPRVRDRRTRTDRSFPFRVGDWMGRRLHWLFGLFGIILCVATAAVMPLFQFMALGYLLEVSGRIRRRGTIRAGFVGFDQAARLASIMIGTWILLWPVTLLGTWWEASWLIDPDSETTRRLRVLQFVGTGLILAHIIAAWFCGGKMRYFFWPLVAPFAFAVWGLRRLTRSPIFRPLLDLTIGRISPRFVSDLGAARPIADWFLPAIIWKSIRRGEFWGRARDGVWDFVLEMKLPYLFWLGLRGFMATLIWLAIPVTIMIVSARSVDAVAVLTGTLGVISFAWVSMHLPILQAHFAAENRWGAMFELSVARESFRRVPVRYLITLLATYVFALPLFLLKIEKIFPELLFLPALVFVAFMLPMRWIAGWTYLQACRSPRRASLWFRWPAWLVQLTLALAFAGFAFVMRFVIWSGAAGLFEQHAFLVPAPFVEWPF